MMFKPMKTRRAERQTGEIDALFASRAHHDGFPSFYGGFARNTTTSSIDDLASAYRLYLYLGELRNRK